MPLFTLRYLQLICLIFIILFLSGCTALNPHAKADYTVGIADMDFVFVKGGTFQMGSSSHSSEQPVHSVTVPDLYVGMFEVTYEQFEQYCTQAPRCELPYKVSWVQGDLPIVNATWYDANGYATWLSEKTGLRFRLPTEAEWEYFARAGTITPFWSGTSLPPNSANCADCGSKWDNKMAAPVGSFAPNPWKIYDTAGNVAEWTLDSYTNSYKNTTSDATAVTIDKSKRKIQRGGAWTYKQIDLRSASRDRGQAHRRYKEVGFRLVLSDTDIYPASK